MKNKKWVGSSINFNFGRNNKITNIISKPLITELQDYLKDGNFSELMVEFQSIMDLVEKTHPLYPYYIYSVVNLDGKYKLKSIPSNDEALKLYPENFRCAFTIDKKYNKFKNINELYDFSYKNQTPIRINVKSLKKYLGDKEDPIQEFKDKKIIEAYLVPKKFPEPKPFRLYCPNGDVSYDYLEIGLKTIKDGQFMVLNNKQQENSKIFVEIIYDIENDTLCEFKFNINSKFKNNVDANLQILKFHKNVKHNKKFILKCLENEDLKIEIYNYNINYNLQDNLYYNIQFLGRLLEIEKFFKVKFDLSKFNDVEKEYEILDYLYNSMNGESIKGTFGYIKSIFFYNSNVWEIIKRKRNDNYIDNLTYEENNIDINIMGANIKIKKIIHSFSDIMIKDLEKLLRKVELMDKGDSYEITFIPKVKNAVYKISFQL